MGPSSPVIEILFLIVLLILSAFFSSSETAFMSINKMVLRHMIDEGVKGAKTVEKILEDHDKLLATILVGNTLVNIAASSLATVISIKLAGDSNMASYAIAISTGIMTFLVLVFGEITPKTFAKRKDEEVALFVAPTIAIMMKVLHPIVVAVSFISGIFLKMFGVKMDAVEPYITEDEFKTIVDVSEEEGVIENNEKEMIYNVFELRDTLIKEIMVQRVDIVALELNDSYEKVRELINVERMSRMPVYKESIDDIIGILNVKDLVLLNAGEMENFSIAKYMRDPIYTYEFKKVMDLFNEMKKDRNHIAVVLDEYGGTVGIATMEDLIEEIVGEIDDEYDDENTEIEVISTNEFMVSGSLKIDDLNDLIGLSIESEEFDSVGGFIIGQIGKIPNELDEVIYENIKFIPEEVDKNRIMKVRILA